MALGIPCTRARLLVQQARAVPRRLLLSSSGRRGRAVAAAAMHQGNAGGWGAEPSTQEASAVGSSLFPDTVTEFLARHAQDPEELRRQQPTWEALEWALGSRLAAVTVARREPGLLRMGPNAIVRNVEAMQELRLNEEDIQRSIQKCPQLFLRDYAARDMQCKFEFLEEELGRSPRHVLSKQPHLLLRSLAGMQRKAAFMEHKGHTQLKRTLVWVAMSNADFCFHFGYDVEEFEAFTPPRPQWEGM